MFYEQRQQDFRTLVQRVFRERRRESALTLNVLRTHWRAIVGPELARKTQPLRIERDTLWLAAADACWAYELQFHKRELLNSVQTFLESRALRELRFKAGALAEAQQADPPPADSGAEGPAPERMEALERAAGAIADPALRGVFQRSLAKQQRGRR